MADGLIPVVFRAEKCLCSSFIGSDPVFAKIIFFYLQEKSCLGMMGFEVRNVWFFNLEDLLLYPVYFLSACSGEVWYRSLFADRVQVRFIPKQGIVGVSRLWIIRMSRYMTVLHTPELRQFILYGVNGDKHKCIDPANLRFCVSLSRNDPGSAGVGFPGK